MNEEKIRQLFAQRLDLACKKKGLPEKGRGKQIADILKITPKAVSKWFNAETMPSTANTYVLAEFLDTTPEWLMFGDNNVSFVQVKKSFTYPVLSTVQAGYFREINLLNSLDSEQQYEMISSQIKASENAFYLKIEGQSMLPRFQEGDMVLIDPAIEPKPGKFVAAINDNNEATFKQYKETGEIDEFGRPHFNLVPLNDNFGKLSSKTHNITIIGVAVEHRQCL
ncbi:helix-turn-helix domain-containing protein [[Haemophilus] felis]|uniref:LexA family transcriptional repressor n=1 Tax=[Haemophilus] felis TaxID=123822 RepID=A0A1T0B1S9_9PAST|nr:helix-turn-helix domain-containing protein [[Haemophilus] felis]OOS04140.1 LexA family transcriptional repressor [[Haemophilus] felis]